MTNTRVNDLDTKGDCSNGTQVIVATNYDVTSSKSQETDVTDNNYNAAIKFSGPKRQQSSEHSTNQH